jgi:D-alanyl-D-alanine carboxypeptidase
MSLEGELADILERHVGGRGAAGIAIATSAGAEPVTAWVTRAEAREPAYLAYSITKTFIAALVLSLRDERRLRLDDRLARWAPGVPEAERITLAQLLNHTAGVPDYGGLPAYHEDVRTSPSQPWTFERFVAETLVRGLSFEPGGGWGYSNPGYMLLKRVAERASGISFAALVAERVGRPLGLVRTFVPESVSDLAALAPAPSRALEPDGVVRDVRDAYHPGWVSHGVVASTPSEIARFFAALFGGRLISSASLRELTTLVPVPNAPPQWVRPGYGLGIMGDPASRWGLLWGHNGEGPGYTASAFHAPQLGGVSVCAMCALEGDARAEQMVFAALDALARA